jgi:hypothetical protein
MSYLGHECGERGGGRSVYIPLNNPFWAVFEHLLEMAIWMHDQAL